MKTFIITIIIIIIIIIIVVVVVVVAIIQLSKLSSSLLSSGDVHFYSCSNFSSLSRLHLSILKHTIRRILLDCC